MDTWSHYPAQFDPKWRLDLLENTVHDLLFLSAVGDCRRLFNGEKECNQRIFSSPEASSGDDSAGRSLASPNRYPVSTESDPEFPLLAA